MPYFLVQWKFTADSFAKLRNNPHDRLATSMKLAEAFGGTVIGFYNRIGAYDGVGIFLFPSVIQATAHSIHAMATGAFEKHECECLLTSSEYKDALGISRDVTTGYQAPNSRFGAGSLI